MADQRSGDFGACCRLCLAEKLDPSTRSIFDDATDDRALQQKISTSLQVEIHADDKLSTMVCKPCVEKINEWLSFKQACASNQIKLEQWLHNSEMPEMNILIKEEPVDNDAEVMVNGDVPIVKNEPLEEEYNDLPPPLTPQGPEDVDVELVGQSPASQESQTDSDNQNPLKCGQCHKMFSSSGNRRKHEKVIHGVSAYGSISGSDIGSLSQDERSQSSMDEGPQEAAAEPSREPDNETKKILFAAGLKLLQCNSTPPISLESLSKIELSYIEKCKAMADMYRTLVCACHKVPHPNLKGLLSHLRSLRIWFPVFTCYHCMITFTDRSSSTRHHLRCTKQSLETLVKLSNLRKRSEVKTRLYQNYKCTKCKYMYSFHEDFCTHVDEDHADEVAFPLRCSCDRLFTTLEDYKDHAYVSCLVEFYCDVCFVTVKTLDAFKKHAAEVHDASEGFILLQDDNYKQRRSIPPAHPPKRESYSKEATSVENIITGKRERRSSYFNPPMIEPEIEHKVINPMFMKKVPGTVCPVCTKEYSTNNNMLRHYKTHALDEADQEDVEEDYDDSLYCCPDCRGMFTSAQWEKHKEQHEKKTCGECNKVFQFQSELDQHRSVHLNLKVYRDSKTQSYKSTMVSPNSEAAIVVMCEICDTMFTSKEQLKEHKLTHEMPVLETSEESTVDHKNKKFACNLCNKVYSGYGGLWDHNRKKHPEIKFSRSQFPKQCDQCDKIFYTGGSYFMHKQMHERASQSPNLQRQPPIESPNLPQGSPDEDAEDTESYHTCKRCFKVFSTKSNLRGHMKSHGINYSSPATKGNTKNKVTKKVWCDICHSQFESPASLEQHKSEEHAETEDTMPSLSDEEQDVKTPFVFTCDVCVQTFTTKAALKKHKERHAQERLTLLNTKHNLVYCKYCKISFESPQQLNEHMQDEHMEQKFRTKPKEKPKFACGVCRKLFNTASAMYAHQGWHKRGKAFNSKGVAMAPEEQPPAAKQVKKEPEPEPVLFKCTTCKAVLPNDTALQIHILEKHRNVNAIALPARCNTCNLDFTSQDEYEQHKRFHSLVESNPVRKSFPCGQCPAAFSRVDTLNAHVRQFHRDVVKQEIKCSQCERVFDKQVSLHIHLKVHEKQKMVSGFAGAKPLFSCSICNLGFDLPKDLRAHTIQAHPF